MATLDERVAALEAIVSSMAATYTVALGDSLGSIAQRFGVTVPQLELWNGLTGPTSRVIHNGQVLKLYGGVSYQNVNDSIWKT